MRVIEFLRGRERVRLGRMGGDGSGQVRSGRIFAVARECMDQKCREIEWDVLCE